MILVSCVACTHSKNILSLPSHHHHHHHIIIMIVVFQLGDLGPWTVINSRAALDCLTSRTSAPPLWNSKYLLSCAHVHTCLFVHTLLLQKANMTVHCSVELYSYFFSLYFSLSFSFFSPVSLPHLSSPYLLTSLLLSPPLLSSGCYPSCQTWTPLSSMPLALPVL